MINTAHIAGFVISDVSDVSAASSTATSFSVLRKCTAAVASVFTATVAAIDTTTAKTMYNAAHIAGFVISDVSDLSAASSIATSF